MSTIRLPSNVNLRLGREPGAFLERCASRIAATAFTYLSRTFFLIKRPFSLTLSNIFFQFHKTVKPFIKAGNCAVATFNAAMWLCVRAYSYMTVLCRGVQSPSKVFGLQRNLEIGCNYTERAKLLAHMYTDRTTLRLPYREPHY